MLGLRAEKLFKFMTSENCEHCGAESETTICATCHQELINSLQEAANSDENEELNVAQGEV